MKIIEYYEKELDRLISQENDPLFVEFMKTRTKNGVFTEKDEIELKGYFGGLKVAKEALEKAKVRAKNDNQ